MFRRIESLVLALVFGAPGALLAQSVDIPDDMAVTAIGEHKGEMEMAVEIGDLDIDARMIFEPIQSFDEMFLRDDVVYLMRHGPTDWSNLDEKDVAPTDCANQRVMSPAGREDMRDLGSLLASNDVLPSRIVVSQWCRNQQTVEELLTGISRLDPDAAEAIPVETDGDLNLLLSLQGAPDVTDLRRRIDEWDGDPERDGPLLIVTHYTNIEELTQFRLFEGEIVVVDPDRDNRVLGYMRLASASPDIGHFSETMASPLNEDEQALDMVSRYYDALDAGDDEKFGALLAEDWVVRGATDDGSTLDREAWLGTVARFQDALEDATFDVQELHVSDGVVTVLGELSGRHTGAIFGVPATGREIAVTGIAVHRVEDGRIAESWQMVDRLGLLRQIGAEESQR